MNRKRKKLIPYLIFVILVLSVVVPIFQLLISTDFKNAFELIKTDLFQIATINSFKLALTATMISLLVAMILAFSILRTGIKFKNIISVFLVLPMLIPSISHGTGLIILFGTNGVFTQMFQLNSSIYGFWGIVLGSVLYSYPVAFLMFTNVLKYEDATHYDAAKVLGIKPLNQFKDITLSFLKKTLITTFFAVFTMIITDYGVPLAIGGKFTTLPVLMYQQVIGQLNFSTGSLIGLILLFPAFVAFIIDILNKEGSNQNFINKPIESAKHFVKDIFAYIMCGGVTIFVLLIDVSFVVLAFTKNYPRDMTLTLNNILKTFEMNGIQYLMHSIIIAVGVTIFGVIIATLTAYFTARQKNGISYILHLLTLMTLAIPGIVLGLAYVMTFKNSLIYGTILILILVNTIHFISSPYLMMYNAFGKMNEHLEDVGFTLGVKKSLIFKDVLLPQVKPTLLEMGSYFFINSMITISAVSFLATTANKPFALMINQFESLMVIECSAVVSLIILLINIAIKGIVYLLKKRYEKNYVNI